MGDMADDAIEQMMSLPNERQFQEVYLNRPRILYKFGDGFEQTITWTQKSGQKIALVDMTPSHRGNVVRMLERKIRKLPGVDVGGLHRTPLIKKMMELGIE